MNEHSRLGHFISLYCPDQSGAMEPECDFSATVSQLIQSCVNELKGFSADMALLRVVVDDLA